MRSLTGRGILLKIFTPIGPGFSTSCSGRGPAGCGAEQSVDPGFGDEVGSAFCDESGGGEEAENNAGGRLNQSQST